MKRGTLGIAAVGLWLGAVVAAQADGHRHWHGGHGGARTSIFLGFGGPVWYPRYYYPYAYVPPPTVVVAPPPTYIEPQPEERPDYYWYYCSSPKGYYPYVKKCPQGWMKVVPEPPNY